MSRPLPEGVVVGFAVEDGLEARWDEPRIGALVRSVMAAELPPDNYVIDLHLVSDGAIRALNAAHRGLDAPTDVLSFPLHDPGGVHFVIPPGEATNLGDVVISYPRAVAQALEFGHSTDREVGYLVAHGVLHVLGYDHVEPADRQRMRQREEEALRPLGFIR
jgi:probable rRNA maturation factor